MGESLDGAKSNCPYVYWGGVNVSKTPLVWELLAARVASPNPAHKSHYATSQTALCRKLNLELSKDGNGVPPRLFHFHWLSCTEAEHSVRTMGK